MELDSEEWDQEIRWLLPAARAFLASATTAAEIADLCATLLSTGPGGRLEWSNPDEWMLVARFDPSERECISCSGRSQRLAALRCFDRLWYELRHHPELPRPTQHELDLLRSGGTIHALLAYISRTGCGLYEARNKLRV